MMGPITKYTHQLASADNIPSRVREAFRLAEEEKPGATHLEFPEDIADEQTDSEPLAAQPRAPPARRREGGPRRGRALEAATSPVLVIGAGANRKMTSRMLLQLDREDRHPVRHHPARQGRDRRDASRSSSAARRSRPATSCHRAIEAADLIVNIGHDVIEKPPFFMQQRRRRGDPRHRPTRPRSIRSISRRSR